MAIYRGDNVNLDYGDLELTEELEEALGILDDSCRYGSGGTLDIFESDEDGAEWEAVPCTSLTGIGSRGSTFRTMRKRKKTASETVQPPHQHGILIMLVGNTN
jgi:hypothetical protein